MSAKKKGLSAEDKRKKILEIFFETRDFFPFKDIEKLATKRGVVQQAVKEVLDGLVSDRLVTCEKIGIGNYYYALPSQAVVNRRNKIEELEQELQTLETKSKDLDSQLEAARQARPPSDPRAEKLKIFDELQKEKAQTEQELAKYAANDPAVWEAKRVRINQLKAEINKHVENIWLLQSYCSNKFGIASEDFNEQFQVPADLDTV